jgi:photosystem II stability/assembly factor-like uncharacterized protein
MQNVPKIVRDRLRAATSVANHPDADVLTAFAERSLPQSERGIVLEHLARCDDCRDVVALALPAPEEIQTVITPARGGWLTWPAVRWGFVTAGVLAIVALGVLQLERRSPMREAAKQTAPVEVATSHPPNQPAPPAAASFEKKEKSMPAVSSSANAISAGKTSPELDRRGLIARAEQLPRVMTPRGGGAAGSALGGPVAFGGPKMPTQWQQQNAQVQASSPFRPSGAGKQQAADQTANLNIPPPSQTVAVEASSQAPPVNPEGQNRVETKNQESRAEAQSGKPQVRLDYAAEAVGKAKAPVDVEAANVAVPQTEASANAQELPAATGNFGLTARNLAQLSVPAPSRPPRWTITSAGNLARSFDQGKTWQDVDVNASLAPAMSLNGVGGISKAARAKDDYADKKAQKTALPSVTFRAVAAIGAEVWAGGSNGALYHSADAGGHWTQVVPSVGDAILSGDIVVLEFSDPQHGKITTSTAEIWITSDGGQTWQKQ